MNRLNEPTPGFVDNGRRSLFALVAVSPFLLMGLLSRPAAAQQASSCLDLAKLPMAQRSIRASLGFKMQAPDPSKRCLTCAFYKTATSDCGKCELFENGPTTANSTCDGWAKKE